MAAVERPIVTPEPTCEDIYATFHRLWDDSYEILVRNNNYADAYLVDSTVQWPSPGTSYVDSMDFNWERYYDGNSTAEIVNAAPAPPGILIDGYSYAWWYANFANYGAVLPYGDYSAELIFEYPDAGLLCTIFVDDEILAPTPTPTTNPNATATSTNTLVPTFTNTPVPTQTPIPSSTLTPTNTTEPAPTDTPTPTNTNTPSLTPGDSEPSETPTTIPTEEPTPTPTPTIIIIG